MLSHGPVSTSFDFDTPGKRAGFLDLSHSSNELAFSAVRVPVGMVHGGDGPTVLMSAGSHGDEYEGQVILHRLMQGLDPAQVRGRIIFLPALNAPAVGARARVSPLDQGNMNRSFPGDAASGPTGAIAGFVTEHLISRADLVLDFHSGGTATEYVDCGFLCVGPDTAMNAANLEIARIFGAPFTMVCPIDGTGGDFDTAAHLRQTPFLSCELGGMGRFSPTSFQVGWEATLRVLAHMGLITGQSPAPETRFIDIGAGSAHATAAHHGLAQLHVRPGDVVAQGDPVATLFDTHNFGETREVLLAPVGGVVAVCRRNPMVVPGDHLCLIAPEISDREIT